MSFHSLYPKIFNFRLELKYEWTDCVRNYHCHSYHYLPDFTSNQLVLCLSQQKTARDFWSPWRRLRPSPNNYLVPHEGLSHWTALFMGNSMQTLLSQLLLWNLLSQITGILLYLVIHVIMIIFSFQFLAGNWSFSCSPTGSILVIENIF